jgi:hypothetical protein
MLVSLDTAPRMSRKYFVGPIPYNTVGVNLAKVYEEVFILS